MSTKSDIKWAYTLGQQAALNGEPRAVCPYFDGDDDMQRSWREGYDAPHISSEQELSWAYTLGQQAAINGEAKYAAQPHFNGDDDMQTAWREGYEAEKNRTD